LKSRKLELVLVIGFAVSGAVLLAVGILSSLYGSITGYGLVVFGFLLMFAAYALGVEFGFAEK
jgi:hypothetical protein